MQARKLQKTGNNTIIVSLPRAWVIKNQLKPGDFVFLQDAGEKTLLIKAGSEDREPVSHVGCQRVIEWTIRDIISKYVRGYERIIVEGTGSWKKNKKIKDIVSRILPGVDIVEKEDSLIMNVVIDIDKLNLEEIIRRNVSTLVWMVKSIADAMINGDHALLREIGDRDDEIDRMTLLASRQIHERFSGNKPMHLAAYSLLYYKSILEKLESIGDSIQVVSTNAMVLVENEIKIKPMMITKACETLASLLQKIPEALMNKNIETGNYLIDESKRYIREVLSKMRIERIFVGDGAPEIVEASALMVENLGRAAQICREIGERIIDFSSE